MYLRKIFFQHIEAWTKWLTFCRQHFQIHQAASCYTSQCWPRSMSPYDITRPQWVNSLRRNETQETHLCISKLNIIGSDNGLSPGRRQAIIWTNAGIVLIWLSGTNFSEMLIEIHTFSFKKIHLNRSPARWWPFCLGLNELISSTQVSDSHLSPPGALQSRGASLQWT